MASVPLAIRFDSGQVLNPHRTDDGILLCDAIFARDGVLEYKSPGGKTRREFRPPEENQKAISEFGLASLTLEHPTGLVDESNGDRLRKGISLQTPRYVVVPGKGGFVTGQIAVMSRDAQDAVRRGDASEISAGYKCRIEETPGSWFNPATGQSERYDAIQRDIKVNHIALTRLGRAGPSVKVLGRFDSADLEDNDLAYQVDAQEPPYSNLFTQEEPMSTNGYTPLATLNLPGGSVQVPQDIFNTIQPLLARNDSAVSSLESELEDAEERADSAEAALSDVQGQVQYKDGMIEALRDRLDQAESLLEDADIAWHEDSYVRLDGGKGKKKGKMPAFLEDMEDDEEYVEDMDDMDEDDEDYDEDMEEDEDEDDMPAPAKKTKKDMKSKTKKDSVRSDAVEMVKVIREAEAIGVDFSDLRMDAIDDAADIRRFVVEQKRPNLYRDDASDPYIQALYDAIIDDAMGQRSAPSRRADSGYADELSLVLGTATSGRAMDAGAADRERRMNNFSTPLTANKDNYGKRR